ncbi:helix-turn-helix domain-containing protein, partial [Kitasatospora griseola]|uniref:helix-turn-helix domain-containing protein n=1 Tax=Kitasatospora griseola TaxID=2064 RepID=UPI001E390BA0
MDSTPDAIDALLGDGPRRQAPLPEPAERARLREEYGLTKAETARALGVSTSTFTTWESGRREPQGDGRAAYARLLEGMADRLTPAEPAQESEPVPVPAAQAPSLEAPVTAAAQPVMLDQHPDGSLVMAPPLPCVQCGQASVYRAQGVPMHLGGFCRPAVAVQAATAEHTAPALLVERHTRLEPAGPSQAALEVLVLQCDFATMSVSRSTLADHGLRRAHH